MKILALDVAGTPRRWITPEEAVRYQVIGAIAWSIGEDVVRFRGGYQHSGKQSIVECKSIIAVRGKGFNMSDHKVHLTNQTLFGRDKFTCAYCGNRYFTNQLSRDHIVPTSRGGKDTWMNVITACVACNNYKGNYMLHELDMELRFLPYEPNHYEAIIMQNRTILGDQMDYLKQGLPLKSRIIDWMEQSEKT